MSHGMGRAGMRGFTAEPGARPVLAGRERPYTWAMHRASRTNGAKYRKRPAACAELEPDFEAGRRIAESFAQVDRIKLLRPGYFDPLKALRRLRGR